MLIYEEEVIGYVVKHKDSGVIYAIQTRQFNDTIHIKLRDMVRGESIKKYRPHFGDTARPVGVMGDPSAVTVQLRIGTKFTDEMMDIPLEEEILTGEIPSEKEPVKPKKKKEK